MENTKNNDKSYFKRKEIASLARAQKLPLKQEFSINNNQKEQETEKERLLKAFAASSILNDTMPEKTALMLLKQETPKNNSQKTNVHRQPTGLNNNNNIKNRNNRNNRNNKNDTGFTDMVDEPNLITHFSKNLEKSLKVIFLGGVGEIGKNITALEYGNDIIVIDSGLAFPGEDMPGIDMIIPDFEYLKENKSKIKALLITHGHEDHIGSVPFFLKELGADIPIYGSDLTMALIENKLMEHKIKPKGFIVKPRQSVKLGTFYVEFIKVNHSIAGSFGLSITTPVGVVFHTGDFKIDYTPVDAEVIDIGRIAEIGKKGVKLLLCESTNVMLPGFTLSETTLGKTLEDMFITYKKERLFFATFASNTYRLAQIINLAEKYSRKIVFTGRSMVNVSDICIKLGYLKMNKNNIIEVEQMNRYKPEELCIITTGSQGEPMAALSRMARGEFNKISVGEGDIIVFSSSPIPGNEKAVNRIENQLCRKGATIINDEITNVHVSGHAMEEEIKAIHALLKPQFFIPVHGEYKHLNYHQHLALKLGMEKRNIIMPDVGLAVEVTEKYIKQIGQVPAGIKLVDGLGIGDADSMVLRERKQLSEEGICIAVVGMNMASKTIIGEANIITRGLIYNEESSHIIAEAKECVNKSIES